MGDELGSPFSPVVHPSGRNAGYRDIPNLRQMNPITSPASVLIAYTWAITATIGLVCRSIRKRKVPPVVSTSER